jgi:hypothetical protein
VISSNEIPHRDREEATGHKMKKPQAFSLCGYRVKNGSVLKLRCRRFPQPRSSHNKRSGVGCGVIHAVLAKEHEKCGKTETTPETSTPAAAREDIRRGPAGDEARAAAVTQLMSLAMACRQSEAKWVQRDKTKFWARREVLMQSELRASSAGAGSTGSPGGGPGGAGAQRIIVVTYTP